MLVCQEGLISQGLVTLSMPRSKAPHLLFTRSIFLICKGFLAQGMERIHRLEGDINFFETMNAYGTQLIEYLLEIRVQDNVVGN